MGLRLTGTARDNGIGGITAPLHGAGVIQIWSGSRPGTPGGTPGGTKLVTFDCTGAPFGISSSGSGEKHITSLPCTGTIHATGTAGFFQWVSDTVGGSVLCDGTVGVSGSGEDCILSSLSLSTTGSITLDSFSVTLPQNC